MKIYSKDGKTIEGLIVDGEGQLTLDRITPTHNAAITISNLGEGCLITNFNMHGNWDDKKGQVTFGRKCAQTMTALKFIWKK